MNQLSEKELADIQEKQVERIPPQTQEDCLNLMIQISETIKTGADEFLKKEYTYLALFCALFGALIYLTVDLPTTKLPYTTVAFFVGALTSMLCGVIGMRIAVYTNVRTTYACNESIDKGFQVAFNGGQVLGFCLVGIAILVLQLLILTYKQLLIP